VAGVFEQFNKPVVPGAFLIRFRLNKPGLAQFYRRYFNSPLGRPCLDRLAVGGVQKNITGTAVLSLLVPHPQVDEVERGSDILAATDHRLSIDSSELGKLRLLKSGLLNDLLTGKVRVCVPEGEC